MEVRRGVPIGVVLRCVISLLLLFLVVSCILIRVVANLDKKAKKQKNKKQNKTRTKLCGCTRGSQKFSFFLYRFDSELHASWEMNRGGLSS